MKDGKILNTREDWTLFRSLETLPQVMGAPVEKLAKIVAKELTDNALDAGFHCEIGEIDENSFYVQDDGVGIEGEDKDIAELFSISRPLKSSKHRRMPQRGALGNGLRVVAAAVLCTGGNLTVSTSGRTLKLTPQYDDGTTQFERVTDYAGKGTGIKIKLPDFKADLSWARQAIKLAKGSIYKGKPSAYFYTGESFYEYINSLPDSVNVREFVESFDNCSGSKAGTIAKGFSHKKVKSLSRYEAETLLGKIRKGAKPIKNARLGSVGRLEEFDGYSKVLSLSRGKGYKRREGVFSIDAKISGHGAKIPFVVEAWCREERNKKAEACVDIQARIFVNRTPIIGEIRAFQHKGSLTIWGCGLDISIKQKELLNIWVNVITPYMPISSNGKEPDFSKMNFFIQEAVQKAISNMKRKSCLTTAKVKKKTQKDAVIGYLSEAINKVSDNKRYRYSLRQLYYVVRPYVMEEIKQDITYENFSKIIADYESNLGNDLDGIYRDARGTLYHPHTGEIIPLGTLNVEKYKRPVWTFNKILYSEKEGFFEILRAEKWPEKNDCALLTSKGFASRAARDIIDLLGETGEDIVFFCIHDADAAGTMIVQSLQAATKARGERKVKIINLGLEPWEGIKMKLEKEAVKAKKKNPVADYIGKIDKGEKWEQWLQENRMELNAMDTATFIKWLDDKMKHYEQEKLIPPLAVLSAELTAGAQDESKRIISERILREAKVEERINAEFEGRKAVFTEALTRHKESLVDSIKKVFLDVPEESWREPVQQVAEQIAGEVFDK